MVLGWTSWILLFACHDPTAPTTSLPYYEARDFTPQWWSSRAVPADLHRIPRFALTDHRGRTVTEAALDGHVTIASFFFTRCGGICPKLVTQLHRVDAAFADRDDVKLLSHSVMPSTDTVPVLAAFAERNAIVSPRWHLLTGPRDTIYALGRTAYFVEEDLGEQPDPDAFLHTENVVLVDRHRRLRGIYNGLDRTAMDRLVEDARVLLAEPASGVDASRTDR